MRIYYDPLLGIVNPCGWEPRELLRIYAGGTAATIVLWTVIWFFV